VAVAFGTFAAGCALGRSDVKSLHDREARRIRLDDAPIESTIAALNALPGHCGPAKDHRVRDEEFHVYQVIGRIVRAQRERDHDIHIVLEDLDNPGARIVVESNDPDFHANVKSPYRDRIAVARGKFDELVKQSGAQRLNDVRGIVVRVSGVGFFDMNHFQVGRSRSCIELHPILAIEQVREYSPERIPNAPLDESSKVVVTPPAVLRGGSCTACGARSAAENGGTLAPVPEREPEGDGNQDCGRPKASAAGAVNQRAQDGMIAARCVEVPHGSGDYAKRRNAALVDLAYPHGPRGTRRRPDSPRPDGGARAHCGGVDSGRALSAIHRGNKVYKAGVVHEVSLKAVERWLHSPSASPKEMATKIAAGRRQQ